MQGHYDFGDGRKKEDPNYMIFSERNCNYPQPKYAVWWLTQFRRWGMVDGDARLRGRRQAGDAHRHLRRGDEGARRTSTAAANNEPETLFDGVTFDPTKPEEYAQVVRGQEPARRDSIEGRQPT